MPSFFYKNILPQATFPGSNIFLQQHSIAENSSNILSQ